MKSIVNFEKDRMDMKQMASVSGGGTTGGSKNYATNTSPCGDTSTVCHMDGTIKNPLNELEEIVMWSESWECDYKPNPCI